MSKKINPNQYYQTDSSVEKPILQLENTKNRVGAHTTAWLGKLEKDGIHITPALYRHSSGYNPQLANLIQGKSDNLHIDALIHNTFENRMNAISDSDDAKTAQGELTMLTDYYKGLRTGEQRHFRKEDIQQALNDIKASYDKKYKDENSKKQREQAYQQLTENLELRLDSPHLLKEYIKKNSPMKGKSSSEVTQQTIVTHEKGSFLSALGYNADVVCSGKGQYTVISGPRASKKDRLAAIEKAIALTAADQTNEKGEVTGNISINTDDLVVAENAYIFARLQGFEPSQIKITCKDKPFVINHQKVERNINIIKQKNDRDILNALRPEIPDRSEINQPENIAFESESSDKNTTNENSDRTVKARLSDQPVKDSALGRAYKENKETALSPEDSHSKTAKTTGTPHDSKTAKTTGTPHDSKTAGASGTPPDSKTAGASGTSRDNKTAGATGTSRDNKTAGATGTPRDNKTAGATGTSRDNKTAETTEEPRPRRHTI